MSSVVSMVNCDSTQVTIPPLPLYPRPTSITLYSENLFKEMALARNIMFGVTLYMNKVKIMDGRREKWFFWKAQKAAARWDDGGWEGL